MVSNQATERIVSLDVLRGFALLGILVMNIQSYSMPGAAYINPTAFGDLSGINLWTWMVSHVLADQKFMTIFSMLFGAGVCVFAERAERKRGGSAALHYRRMFWLLVFGFAHAYLLWYGDILVAYGCCGLWVYLFRNRSVTALVVAGLLFTGIGSLISIWFGLSMEHFPPEAMVDLRNAWRPEAGAITAEVSAYRGDWLTQMPYRMRNAAFFETFIFLFLIGWRATGMMLLGMALYKSGVLSAQKSDGFYVRMTLLGIVFGGAVVVFGMQRNFAHGFTLEYSMYLGSQFNYWGSIALALGYIGVLMLAVRRAWLASLQSRLAAIGKTAFSNYILQTLICTTIFYGHGFGLFADVPRIHQLLIVMAIWLLQLSIAPIWLQHYRYGPLEWLWRSLTYWRFQPLGKSA